MCDMPPVPSGGMPPTGDVQSKRQVVTTILALAASSETRQTGGMGNPFMGSPCGGDNFSGGGRMGGPGGGCNMMDPQMMRQLLQNPEMMDMAILIMLLQAVIQSALGNQAGQQGNGGPGGMGPGGGGGFPFGGGGGGDPCAMGGSGGPGGGSQLSQRFALLFMQQTTTETTGGEAKPDPKVEPKPEPEPTLV